MKSFNLGQTDFLKGTKILLFYNSVNCKAIIFFLPCTLYPSGYNVLRCIHTLSGVLAQVLPSSFDRDSKLFPGLYYAVCPEPSPISHYADL